MKHIDDIKNYFLTKNGHYFKKEEMPSYDSPEMKFLQGVEIDDKLDSIETHTKTIKIIMLAFLAINGISLIISFVSLLKLLSFFK